VQRHDLLTGLHERLQPRGYLEIGIRDGAGLARSRTRTVGVDPDYNITAEVACDLQLVRATSDDFFDRAEPLAWLPGGVADLTFIDGMNLYEYALRDFINAERYSAPGAVIVFDDMLPREVVHANRDRASTLWAGDVYKVIPILEEYRPDLAILPVDTDPTGTLIVAGLDPTSTVLNDHYEEIVATYDSEDPQPVPQEILTRATSIDPEKLFASTAIFDILGRARASGDDLSAAVEALRALRGSFDPDRVPQVVSRGPVRKPRGTQPNASGPQSGLANPLVQLRGDVRPRGATAAILVVNGFDRRSKDPLDVAEALEFPWIELCLNQIAKHTNDIDYEVLVWDNSYLPEHAAILHGHGVSVFEHPHHKDVTHGRSLDGLVRQVHPKTDYVVTIDTDSFPVHDDWLVDLIKRLDGGAMLAGVWRDEMAPDITPYVHPSGLAARRQTILDLNVSFQVQQAQDAAQNLTIAVRDRGGELDGLRRSNGRNAHFLMGGIYGGTIYHHGAGSRRASFWTSDRGRADEVTRVTLRDAVFARTGEYVEYLRGNLADAAAIEAGLDPVVEQVAIHASESAAGSAASTPDSKAAGVRDSVRRFTASLKK
jgi:hypothetical protein